MRFGVGDVIAKRFSSSWFVLKRLIVAARPTGYSWSYTFAPLFTFRSEGTADPFFVYWVLVERAPRHTRERNAGRAPHTA